MKNSIEKKALKLAGICVFAFLTSCSVFGDGAGAEPCGENSPTYVYFAQIAPGLSGPNKYAADTSAAFKLDYLQDLSRIRAHYRPKPRVGTYRLNRFSSDEMECWAEQGDQVAALKLSNGPAFASFQRVSNLHLKKKLEFYPPLFNDPDFLENLKIEASWAERAARRRDDWCPVGNYEDWKALPQCQPDTMLAVFEYGVPEAHSALSGLHRTGPKAYKNISEAKRHAVLYDLFSGPYKYDTFYSCEVLAGLKDEAALRDLFYERLGYDAFFPDGFFDPSLRPGIRTDLKEKLSACP